MAMFSDDLFNVFEEDNNNDTKSKKKLKRPGIAHLTKSTKEDSLITSTKKPKIDFGSCEINDDKSGEEKMEEAVKEGEDRLVNGKRKK